MAKLPEYYLFLEALIVTKEFGTDKEHLIKVTEYNYHDEIEAAGGVDLSALYDKIFADVQAQMAKARIRWREALRLAREEEDDYDGAEW